MSTRPPSALHCPAPLWPNRLPQLLFLVGLFGFGFVVAAARGDDWPRFRGPNGSGQQSASSFEFGQFKESETLRYEWRVRLPGGGHSSPVVKDGRVYTLSAISESGERFVTCIDLESGQRVWQWQEEATTFKRHKLNSLASTTPVVDENALYVCWPSPERLEVLALSLSGEKLWRRDLGTYRAGHGGGASPIVCQDQVIISKLHEGPSEIVALEKKTGDVSWRCPRDAKSTWITPCVFDGPQGPELIVTDWTHGVTAVSPVDGAVLWTADVFNKDHVESSIASPVVAGDRILAVSGWLSVRQELVAVQPPRQQTSAQSVYTIDRGVPLCTTPLVVDDQLFLWSDEGIVSCFDLATGSRQWSKRVGGTFYASPIHVSGHVLNVSADGELIILQAADKYVEFARFDLEEGCHATPAAVDRWLVLRTFSHLMAIKATQSD